MNLTDYLPHIAAALGTGAATATVDHLIAKAESLIPNSLWQLVKYLITKQPVRASQETKEDVMADPSKVVKGFAALLMGLAEHAPELIVDALSVYADVQSGNVPKAALDASKAVPALASIGSGIIGASISTASSVDTQTDALIP